MGRLFDTSGQTIVNATLAPCKEAMNNLLPTTSNSIYMFKLRDFRGVIQKLMLSLPSTIDTPVELIDTGFTSR